MMYPGLRTAKPCLLGELKPANTAVPFFYYIGNGKQIEKFSDYCNERMAQQNLNPDDYYLIDMSSMAAMCYFCLPEFMLHQKSYLDFTYERLFNSYSSNFYVILEFESVSEVAKFLKCAGCEPSCVKYDDKREVFYVKLVNCNSLSVFEFGEISNVPDIRFNFCADCTKMFT